jgi:galactokinase
MSTTRRAADVTIGTLTRIGQVAGMIKEQLLQPRRTFLKHKRPKSDYVFQLRRCISSDKATPVQMLMAISTADLDDHVPLSLVLQPYQSMLSELTEYAQLIERAETSADAPVYPLVQRENRFQSERDAAERDLLAHPNSIEAHDRFLEATAHYESENDRLVKRVRAGRARLTQTGRLLSAAVS